MDALVDYQVPKLAVDHQLRPCVVLEEDQGSLAPHVPTHLEAVGCSVLDVPDHLVAGECSVA